MNVYINGARLKVKSDIGVKESKWKKTWRVNEGWVKEKGNLGWVGLA